MEISWPKMLNNHFCKFLTSCAPQPCSYYRGCFIFLGFSYIRGALYFKWWSFQVVTRIFNGKLRKRIPEEEVSIGNERPFNFLAEISSTGNCEVHKWRLCFTSLSLLFSLFPQRLYKINIRLNISVEWWIPSFCGWRARLVDYSRSMFAWPLTSLWSTPNLKNPWSLVFRILAFFRASLNDIPSVSSSSPSSLISAILCRITASLGLLRLNSPLLR